MKQYYQEIAQFLDHYLDRETLVTQYDIGYLRNLVEACFLQKAPEISKEEQAITILTELFSRLVPGFSFRKFVQRIFKEIERRAFLTRLLFHIYAMQLPLKRLHDPTVFELYLLQVLASCASQSTIRAHLKRMSFANKMRCLGYCYAFYDEGSYRILELIKNASLKKLLEKGNISRHCVWLWAQKKKKLTKSDLVHFVKSAKKTMLQKTKLVHARLVEFATFYGLPLPTFEKIQRFVAIFGLYDHQLPEKLLFLENLASLDDKLMRLRSYPQEAKIFVERILQHAEAIANDPRRYTEGFDTLVYALPTVGKPLKNLTWLESTLKGMRDFGKIAAIHPHPVFVFDQSERELFVKNARYIDSLKKRYGIEIIHLDKRTILWLAESLGLYDLLVTGPFSRFGYGGARNTIFLLAPLISVLYRQGHKNLQELDKNELKTLYAKVMQENTLIIHMGDDDVRMPGSSVFSDSLWGYLHKDQYACRYGYIEGRCTSDINFVPRQVLYRSEKILSQCFWMKKPSVHGMSGLLSKPKLCLNLPFGQEEHHLLCLVHELWDMRRAAIHLGGWRYPAVSEIPHNRFCGLASWLRAHTCDIFERLFVTELLDPNNRYDSCALPWNLNNREYSSFTEVIAGLCSDDMQKAMQKQFWKNFSRNQAAFHQNMPQDAEILSSHALQELIDADLKLVFDEFLQNEAQLEGSNELLELYRYFCDLQEEARIYKQYVERIERARRGESNAEMALDTATREIEQLTGKKIYELVIAHALYLLCKSVGAAGFQKALKTMSFVP